MERNTTWSKIGTGVEEAKTISEVLEKSNLDYNVVSKNLVTVDGAPINSKMANVKEDDVTKVMGVVSKGYRIIQNSEAFDFMDYVDNIEYLKAGETKGGMVYVIGKLPEVTILGDKFTPNVIMQNGFNGRYAIKAAICPLRIVCQNQFNIAFRETSNTMTIKHSSMSYAKMNEGKKLIISTANYMNTLNAEAEKYAKIKMTDFEIEKFFNDYFPIKEDMSDCQKSRIEEKRNALRMAYRADDNTNFKNTAWGLINAMSDYITHIEPNRKTNEWEEKKFMTVTLSPVFVKFMNMIDSRCVA